MLTALRNSFYDKNIQLFCTIANVSLILVAKRILNQLITWDRHIHLIYVEVECTICTPYIYLLNTIWISITLWIVVCDAVYKIIRLLEVCLETPFSIELLTTLLVYSNCQ